ncbi:MAG: hypothetical protein GY755_08520 [Chloroflexi bacterium]|nr:hypothetical protein [Chloroflexota bacterium]
MSVIKQILLYPFMKPMATKKEQAEKIRQLELAGNLKQAEEARLQEIKKEFDFIYGIVRIIVFAAFLPIALPALILFKGLPALISHLRS